MGTRQICIVQYCVCVYDKEVEQLYVYIYIYYSLERGKYLFPKNHSAHRPLHFCFAYAIVGKWMSIRLVLRMMVCVYMSEVGWTDFCPIPC